jgi:hypothetical protein
MVGSLSLSIGILAGAGVGHNIESRRHCGAMPFAYFLDHISVELYWKPVGARDEVTTIYCNRPHEFYSAANIANSLLYEEGTPVSVNFSPGKDYVCIKGVLQIGRYRGECDSLRRLLAQIQADLKDSRDGTGDFATPWYYSVFRHTDDWDTDDDFPDSVKRMVITLSELASERS